MAPSRVTSHDGTSEQECDRGKVRTDTIYHGFLLPPCHEVFVSIFHWNVSLLVQIYTGSDCGLVSCPDLDNLDSHHYPSDYKLSPLRI